MDKMKLQYLRLMVVLQYTHNGTYQLSELDSAISKLCYAAFQLIPYHACSQSFIPVTHVVDGDDLASLEYDDTLARGADLCGDESTQEGRNLNPQGGVRMEYALTSETSPVTHSALSLSVDPPSRFV